jgi:hypothetical protein
MNVLPRHERILSLQLERVMGSDTDVLCALNPGLVETRRQNTSAQSSKLPSRSHSNRLRRRLNRLPVMVRGKDGVITATHLHR